jgi:hypothetical protein
MSRRLSFASGVAPSYGMTWFRTSASYSTYVLRRRVSEMCSSQATIYDCRVGGRGTERVLEPPLVRVGIVSCHHAGAPFGKPGLPNGNTTKVGGACSIERSRKNHPGVGGNPCGSVPIILAHRGFRIAKLGSREVRRRDSADIIGSNRPMRASSILVMFLL